MKNLYLLLFLLLRAATVFGYVPPDRNVTLDDVLRQPKDGWVYDYADLLTDREEVQLNYRIMDLERQGQGQMAIVVVDHLEDRAGRKYDPFDYGVQVFNHWGIGNKREDDGILLLVSLNPRKLFINTGYGKEVENVDALCARICRDVIAPQMKRKQFYGAFEDGIDQLYKTRPLRMQYNTDYRTNLAAEYAQGQADKVQRAREDSVYALPASVAARARQKVADDAESAKTWETCKTVCLVLFGSLFSLGVFNGVSGFIRKRRKKRRDETEAKGKASAASLAAAREKLAALNKLNLSIRTATENTAVIGATLQAELLALLPDIADLQADRFLVERSDDAEFMDDFTARAQKVEGLALELFGRVYDAEAEEAKRKSLGARLASVRSLVDGFSVARAEQETEKYAAQLLEVIGEEAKTIGKKQTAAGYAAAVALVKKAAAQLECSAYDAAALSLKGATEKIAALEGWLTYLSEQPGKQRAAKDQIISSLECGRNLVDQGFKEGTPTHQLKEQLEECHKSYDTGVLQNWALLLGRVQAAYEPVERAIAARRKAEQDAVDAEARRLLEVKSAFAREEQRKKQAVIDEQNRAIRKKREAEEDAERRARQRRREEEEEGRRRSAAVIAAAGRSSSSSSGSSSSWGGGSSGGGGGGSDW